MAAKLEEILRAIERTKDSLTIQGVVGSLRGHLLAALLRSAPHRTRLLITATPERAEIIRDDCELFLRKGDRSKLILFPAPDVQPYTQLNTDPDLWAERLDVLYRLLRHEPIVIVAPIHACLRRIPPQQFISSSLHTLRRGEVIYRDELLLQLGALGYEDVPLVEDIGTCAARGAIVDLWPPTSEKPIRLEWEEDRIVSLRTFQPTNQRSLDPLAEAAIIPVRDFLFSTASREKAVVKLRRLAEVIDMPAPERRAVTEKIREGLAFGGIDSFLPLFHDSLSLLSDYLPSDAEIIIDEPERLEEETQKFFKRTHDLARATTSPERLIPLADLYVDLPAWRTATERHRLIAWNGLATAGKLLQLDVKSVASHFALPQEGSLQQQWFSAFCDRISQLSENGYQVVITCPTESQAERLQDLFSSHELPLERFDAPLIELEQLQRRTIRVKIGRSLGGFVWPEEKFALIADEEIFRTKHLKRARPTPSPAEAFTSFAELAAGDFLVHEQHGIGRYQGLQHLIIGDIPGDYLLLEYLGGDKLYLPVYRTNLVQRYIGSEGELPLLDKLGGTRFAELQKKIRREIVALAKDLLQTEALRAIQPGFAFPVPDEPYEEFAAAFPYDETPDQERSIEEVLRDMQAAKPMDRLVCGDVGFGKTEVAMRAAFLAAMAGKQVALLVPTTVLAFQHHATFSARFRGTPINIAMLSRFRSPAEQKKIVADIKAGTVDIVVGTHRLLSRDVAFRDLGLLILDEEHRFGVRHKERIKKLRATVDVLTLTATPIPRTLNLSLVGLRDISIINTPPPNRQAISTQIAPFDRSIIRHAILAERERGGQVFFVHNRVETMGSILAELKGIVPEANIAMAHGQMNESALERVMLDFLKKKSDVLLCSTIIESGLDIPNANTIIIHRADCLGLAQLYQLRGRVGRSNAHAYAYLLTPAEGDIALQAKRRLAIISRFTELGSGFQIAMHDLEIRGAGNILGTTQSGHIAAVGFELYTKLLARTIRKLQGKSVHEEEIDPELNLNVEALLPASYIADEGARIELYRRLANRASLEEIEALRDELIDRFGPLPTAGGNLLELMKVKLQAVHLQMAQLAFNGQVISCKFAPTTPVDARALLKLAAEFPTRFRIVPPDRITMFATHQTGLEAAKNLLSTLFTCVSEP